MLAYTAFGALCLHTGILGEINQIFRLPHQTSQTVYHYDDHLQIEGSQQETHFHALCFLEALVLSLALVGS